ncbi:MAG: redox-sensing transcriptional repressor Rex [Candidatus Eisenbacteria bacterium]|nr:redox-sensing transcriptional repressor Rex [Candidatus Eisenbacteria bacterium]
MAKRSTEGSQMDRRPTRALRQRLPLYFRIGERLLRLGKGEAQISELASAQGIADEEANEDMEILGIERRSGGSVAVASLHDVAEHLLGLRPVNTAVLVGMGRLGSAVAAYEGFHQHGMRIVAVFDANPEKIGRFVSGLRILPMEQLEDVLNIFQIRLAVLTVSPDEAQDVATRLARAGVQAIWNFAPVKLTLPEDIVVRNEDLAAGLAQLCRDLRETNLRRLPPEEGGADARTENTKR